MFNCSQIRARDCDDDMLYLFSSISESLLVLAIIDIIIVSVCSFIFIQTFKKSLTSVSEKSEGPIYFYQNSIRNLFAMDFSKINIVSFIHLVTMHLAVPLLGLGLLLYSDWNFIALVLGIIWSYQITNRFFPGYQQEEK